MTDLIINLPFPGFYDSRLSGEVDTIEEQEAEWMVERQEEDGVTPELRLDASEFGELLFKHTTYSKAYEVIAEAYADVFNDKASEVLGFDLGMTFESMSSPREYNFSTDRLFAHIPLASVSAMFARSQEDDHKALRKVIRDRFTSRDGFSSFYDNDASEWLEKPLDEWDHNELGTLLIAVLGDTDELEWDVYYRLAEHGCREAWEGAVDWAAFDAEVLELRADKAAELHEDDPEWVAPEPRCPLTLDMFNH